MMRALTVLQPWATPIALGLKPLENRTYAPPASVRDGWLAIHAGKNRIDPEDDPAALVECLRRMESRPSSTTPPLTLRTLLDHAGHVLALVRLAGVAYSEAEVAALTPNQRAWYVPGSRGWLIGERRQLPKPVPVRGQQGIWFLPPDVEALVRAQVIL